MKVSGKVRELSKLESKLDSKYDNAVFNCLIGDESFWTVKKRGKYLTIAFNSNGVTRVITGDELNRIDEVYQRGDFRQIRKELLELRFGQSSIRFKKYTGFSRLKKLKGVLSYESLKERFNKNGGQVIPK
ncbi:hypothetical protein COF68_05515 [Bacillus toyonensis]|uniref:hypothetical protein n=1 Tax=Bacillus toyonensis TaxID=155322 RepID=UPI000BFCBB24|nr:hypothetical protein [Bacillus toyonensis]PHE64301.1 hypothetical protein COF68_05515 [Bacillus toyonensis]